MVRCFIGIFPPDDIKNKIINLQNELEKLPMKAKFVEPENLHISMSFLGEVEDGKVEIISRILNSITEKFQKFEVELSDIKLIPNEKYVRVLALDAKEENNILEQMRKEIEEKIGGDSKPAHLTICRVKSILNRAEFLEKIEKTDSKVGKFFVSSVALIKSTLQKPGPVYSVLHESNLV